MYTQSVSTFGARENSPIIIVYANYILSISSRNLRTMLASFLGTIGFRTSSSSRNSRRLRDTEDSSFHIMWIGMMSVFLVIEHSIHNYYHSTYIGTILVKVLEPFVYMYIYIYMQDIVAWNEIFL